MKHTLEIGAIIKHVSEEKNIGPTKLGKMIGTSKQNVYGIFKRKSVKSDLLLELSNVLGHNFFKYYVDELAKLWAEDPNAPELSGSSHAADLAKLNKEIEHLNETNGLLRGQIVLANNSCEALAESNELWKKRVEDLEAKLGTNENPLKQA